MDLIASSDTKLTMPGDKKIWKDCKSGRRLKGSIKVKWKRGMEGLFPLTDALWRLASKLFTKVTANFWLHSLLSPEWLWKSRERFHTVFEKSVPGKLFQAQITNTSSPIHVSYLAFHYPLPLFSSPLFFHLFIFDSNIFAPTFSLSLAEREPGWLQWGLNSSNSFVLPGIWN